MIKFTTKYLFAFLFFFFLVDSSYQSSLNGFKFDINNQWLRQQGVDDSTSSTSTTSSTTVTDSTTSLSSSTTTDSSTTSTTSDTSTSSTTTTATTTDTTSTTTSTTTTTSEATSTVTTTPTTTITTTVSSTTTTPSSSTSTQISTCASASQNLNGSSGVYTSTYDPTYDTVYLNFNFNGLTFAITKLVFYVTGPNSAQTYLATANSVSQTLSASFARAELKVTAMPNGVGISFQFSIPRNTSLPSSGIDLRDCFGFNIYSAANDLEAQQLALNTSTITPSYTVNQTCLKTCGLAPKQPVVSYLTLTIRNVAWTQDYANSSSKVVTDLVASLKSAIAGSLTASDYSVNNLVLLGSLKLVTAQKRRSVRQAGQTVQGQFKLEVSSPTSSGLTLQTVSNQLTQLASDPTAPFSAAQVSQTDPTITTTSTTSTTTSSSTTTTAATTTTVATNSTKAPIDTSAYESQVAIGLTVSVLLFLLIFFGCLFLFKYWESRQDPGSTTASPSSSSGIGSTIRSMMPKGKYGQAKPATNIQMSNLPSDDFDVQFTNNAFSNQDDDSNNPFHFTDFTNSREVGIDVDINYPTSALSTTNSHSTTVAKHAAPPPPPLPPMPPKEITFELVNKKSPIIMNNNNVKQMQLTSDDDDDDDDDDDSTFNSRITPINKNNKPKMIDGANNNNLSRFKNTQNLDTESDFGDMKLNTSETDKDLFDDNFVEVSRNRFDDALNKHIENMESSVRKQPQHQATTPGSETENSVTTTTNEYPETEINNALTRDIEENMPELFTGFGQRPFGFSSDALNKPTTEPAKSNNKRHNKSDEESDDDDDIDISIDSDFNNFKAIDSNAFKNVPAVAKPSGTLLDQTGLVGGGGSNTIMLNGIEYSMPRVCKLELDPNFTGMGIHLCDNQSHMVKDLEPGSPAIKSGLRPGDKILMVGSGGGGGTVGNERVDELTYVQVVNKLKEALHAHSSINLVVMNAIEYNLLKSNNQIGEFLKEFAKTSGMSASEISTNTTTNTAATAVSAEAAAVLFDPPSEFKTDEYNPFDDVSINNEEPFLHYTTSPVDEFRPAMRLESNDDTLSEASTDSLASNATTNINNQKEEDFVNLKDPFAARSATTATTSVLEPSNNNKLESSFSDFTNILAVNVDDLEVDTTNVANEANQSGSNKSDALLSTPKNR